jgi:hypothetical protein
LGSRDRREKDLSTPLAGLESNKYDTGPTRTGTVSTPSCKANEIFNDKQYLKIYEKSTPSIPK